MSPFLGLGGRCVGPPAERARNLPSSGRTPAVGPRLAVNAEDLSLTRFAQLLALAILGLAGLLTLGVGGVVLLQGHAFPAPGLGVVRHLRLGYRQSPSFTHVNKDASPHTLLGAGGSVGTADGESLWSPRQTS